MNEGFSVKEIGRKTLLGFSVGIAGIWIPIIIANYADTVSDKLFPYLSMFNYYFLFILTGSTAGLIYKSFKAFIKGFSLSMIAIFLLETLKFLKLGGQAGFLFHLISFYLLPGFFIGLAVSWEGKKVKLVMSSIGGAIAQFIMVILTISLGEYLYKLTFSMPGISWISNAQVLPYLLFGALIWFFIGLAEETYKIRFKPKIS